MNVDTVCTKHSWITHDTQQEISVDKWMRDNRKPLIHGIWEAREKGKSELQNTVALKSGKEKVSTYLVSRIWIV